MTWCHRCRVSAGEGTDVAAARSEKGPAWLDVPCDNGRNLTSLLRLIISAESLNSNYPCSSPCLLTQKPSRFPHYCGSQMFSGNISG